MRAKFVVALLLLSACTAVYGADKPKKNAASKGAWKTEIKVSPIDDSTNARIYLLANNTVSSGVFEGRPALNIRCQEKKFEIFVLWKVFLGTEQIPMLSRLDSEPATTENWSASTDSEAVFAHNPQEWSKKYVEHKKLLVQITPYNESPIMTSFDLTGLDKAIEPVYKACGITPPSTENAEK